MGKDLLTEAYLKLGKKLKSESRKIVRDPDRADDVLQDAFIRLWKKGYRLGFRAAIPYYDTMTISFSLRY